MYRTKWVAAIVVLTVVLAAATNVSVWAQEAGKAAPAKPAEMGKMEGKAGEMGKAEAKPMGKKMAGDWFVITTTHTEEECLKAMDEAAATSPAWLSKTYCGCMHGDHTC